MEGRGKSDPAWKNILDDYFQEFMAFCVPDLYSEIDWGKGVVSLDKELLAINKGFALGKRLLDKLYQVVLKTGKKLLIHLEIQADGEIQFSERMFIYFYRIYDKYRIDVVSIAILADGSKTWRPQQHSVGHNNNSMSLKYQIIKLIDYSKNVEFLKASNNIFAKVILIYLEFMQTKHSSKQKRLQTKILLTRGVYEDPRYCGKDVINLYLFIDWLFCLPPDLELVYKEELYKLEEAQKMGYVSTIERMGIQTGIQQGEYTMLLRQLQRKFQTLPESYMNKIAQADPEQLLLWGDRILDAQSLDNVFAD